MLPSCWLLLFLVHFQQTASGWPPRLSPSPPHCCTASANSCWRAALRRPPLMASSSSSSSSPIKPLSPLPPLMEGDIVEYLITQRQRENGQLPPGDRRVLGLGVVNGFGLIHPLCRRKEDDSLLYYDEEQDALDEPLETVVSRVFQQVSYSQRCIENRLLNPHGEEAEDVFEIDEALSEGCGPAIRFS